MSGEDGIFNREHRYLTIGIILAVTIISFEGMAFTTAAPVLAEDLQACRCMDGCSVRICWPRFSAP